MRIRNTTRMGFQAAIAILIAELISWSMQLDRGYWITLSAMALITQTWGESIKRSLERVTMTILGGIFGTLLYFMFASNQTLILVLLLICVFFTVYLIQIYYLVAVFTLTCFVVFLFALLGDWNLILLEKRILDTIVGALIAIGVGCIFMPVKTNITQLFVTYLEKMKAVLTLVFMAKPQQSLLTTGKPLYVEFQTIRKNALSIRYEVLFHRISRHNFQLLLTQLAFCTQYIASLIEAYRWLSVYLTSDDRHGIEVAVQTTLHNLDVLIRRLNNQPHEEILPVANLTELINKAIIEDPSRFGALESEALGFFNIMYYFTRMNTRLIDIFLLLDQVRS